MVRAQAAAPRVELDLLTAAPTPLTGDADGELVTSTR